MDIQELHPASYRGAYFFIASTSTSGGRKISRKLPVDSDKQLLEDMGLRNRAFNVTGTIAPRRDNNGSIITTYQKVRDDLLAALELGGTGILIHPFYGRLENIVAITWSVTEDMRSLGDTPITITFEISNTDGLPSPTTNVISKVQTNTISVTTAAQTSIGGFASIFATNFEYALEKLEAFSL